MEGRFSALVLKAPFRVLPFLSLRIHPQAIWACHPICPCARTRDVGNDQVIERILDFFKLRNEYIIKSVNFNKVN